MNAPMPDIPRLTAPPGFSREALDNFVPLIATDASGITVAMAWDVRNQLGGLYNSATRSWRMTQGSAQYGAREFLDEQLAAGVRLPPKPERASMDYGEAWLRILLNPPLVDDRLAQLEAEMRRRFSSMDHETAKAHVRDLAANGFTEAQIVASTGWKVADVRRALSVSRLS